MQDNADQLYHVRCQARWGHYKPTGVPRYHGQLPRNRTARATILVCTCHWDFPRICIIQSSGGERENAAPNGLLMGTLVWNGASPVLPWVLPRTPSKNRLWG